MSEEYLPILLVEDNPMDADLTKRAFKKRNSQAHLQVARDGEEAVGYLARWEQGEPPPAIVLLDLNLPKISGLDVLKRLRAHPKFGRLPVVVLTSSSEDRDIQTAFSLGANSYIVKPVDYTKFLEVAGKIDEFWRQLNEVSPQA